MCLNLQANEAFERSVIEFLNFSDVFIHPCHICLQNTQYYMIFGIFYSELVNLFIFQVYDEVQS